MRPSFAWFLVLLVVFALERIGELALTRRNLRGSDEIGAGGAENWRWMVAVHVALLVLPAIEVIAFRRDPIPWLFWSALVLLALSQALRWWSINTLGRAWNTRAVVDPSLGFVEDGPYRWIRHPNYLAVVLEFLVLPLAGSAWTSWVVLNLVHAYVLSQRISDEERLLAAVPGYDEAMLQKGRLLPRLWRRS